MKTTFILCGGFNPEETTQDLSAFYKEILKNLPDTARILLVPFAKSTERIPETTARVTTGVNKNKQQKHITIEIASENDFMHQLEKSDAVYFLGGASLKLLDALKNYPNLSEHLSGKVVAGESAGANVFSSFFYSPKSDTVSKGLGILPIKIIPHYKQEYAGKLSNVGVNLEEVLLPEYTHKTFIIN